jgi:hypothetical protein
MYGDSDFEKYVTVSFSKKISSDCGAADDPELWAAHTLNAYGWGVSRWWRH